jgi:3-deoxy-D-manno-octulosonic-acid transferase
MHALYRLAAWIALPGFVPYLARRWLRDRGEVRERLGCVPVSQSDKPTVWIHAASVGEVVGIEPLVREMSRSETGLSVVVSTMTVTGQMKARETLQGAESVFYAPGELRCFVARALGRLRPAALVLAETELWPELIRQADETGCAVAVVNGRISDRGFPRYRLLKRFFEPVVKRVDLWIMQSGQDRERVISLGADASRVFVLGSMKADLLARPDPLLRTQLRRKLGIRAEGLVLVAGSTREGEEAILVDALLELWREGMDLGLVLAPRHPRRFGEVARLLTGRGVRFRRRTELARQERPVADGRPLVLLDTVGELGRVYAAADVAFVGGSLVPAGGHNPLEPAARGVPVLLGPHVENTRETAERLIAGGGGYRVTDRETLAAALRSLGDRGTRERLGSSARKVVEEYRGVSRRVLELLLQHGILPRPGKGNGGGA